MHSAPLLSGWDTAVLVVPFLALWMFGLDEVVAAPGARAGRQRFCQGSMGCDGYMTDADGRPWRVPSSTLVESSIRRVVRRPRPET